MYLMNKTSAETKYQNQENGKHLELIEFTFPFFYFFRHILSKCFSRSVGQGLGCTLIVFVPSPHFLFFYFYFISYILVAKGTMTCHSHLVNIYGPCFVYLHLWVCVYSRHITNFCVHSYKKIIIHSYSSYLLPLFVFIYDVYHHHHYL